MKNELKNKLIFVSGAVFGLALLISSVGIISAANVSWTAPTQPFPTATVNPPLDSSSDTQKKAGQILFTEISGSGKLVSIGSGQSAPISFAGSTKTGTVLLFTKNQSFGVSGSTNKFILSDSSGNTALTSDGLFKISASGLVLPTALAKSPIPGTVYFDSESKKIKLNTDGTANGWISVGENTREQTQQIWKETSDKLGKYLFYAGRQVTIEGDLIVSNVQDTGNIDTSKGVWMRSQNVLENRDFSVNTQSGELDATHSSIRLRCDSTTLEQDCPSLVSADREYVLNATGYDIYIACDSDYLPKYSDYYVTSNPKCINIYNYNDVKDGRFRAVKYIYTKNFTLPNLKNTALLKAGDIKTENMTVADYNGKKAYYDVYTAKWIPHGTQKTCTGGQGTSLTMTVDDGKVKLTVGRAGRGTETKYWSVVSIFGDQRVSASFAGYPPIVQWTRQSTSNAGEIENHNCAFD